MTNQEIKTNAIDLLLCCAFEGGSNYWYLIDQFPFKCDPDRYEDGKQIPGKGRYTKMVEATDLSLDFYDVEAGEGSPVIGTMTTESIEKAWTTLRDERPIEYARAVLGEADADDGDVFLQLAVLGELKYG